MAFTVAKNGMRMYQPSWQVNPGATMKAANRAKWDSYTATNSALGSNLLGAMANQTASSLELTTKIVQTRLQADYAKKLEQAKAGFDVIV
jgi:prophage tail gpP-like protein